MLVVRLVKTPGGRRPIARCKEGLADIRIVGAIPRASASGQAVKLAPRALAPARPRAGDAAAAGRSARTNPSTRAEHPL